jgi:hypothetical protein
MGDKLKPPTLYRISPDDPDDERVDFTFRVLPGFSGFVAKGIGVAVKAAGVAVDCASRA